jgi:putative membrane protein
VQLMQNALWIVGVFTLLVCWVGPLPAAATHRFSAHMTIHMAVVAVAAPLLALGVAGGPCDPVRKLPRLFSPIPASILELIVVWAWHAPAFHQAARHTTSGLIAEQGMFLVCGLLVWLSAFGGKTPRSGDRTASGVIGLLLTSMHMTLLGALLIFAPRPLYDHPVDFTLGTPLGEQQLGGAIMLLVGGLSYLAGGLWLTVDLVRGPNGIVEETA